MQQLLRPNVVPSRPADSRVARRWFARASFALFLAAFAVGTASAQARTFPEKTRLGTLEVVVFPKARLDGKDILMAPGARILNESNLIQVPSTVRGEKAVRYRTDMQGQVIEAWILTPEELRKAQDEARAAAAKQ